MLLEMKWLGHIDILTHSQGPCRTMKFNKVLLYMIILNI